MRNKFLEYIYYFTLSAIFLFVINSIFMSVKRHDNFMGLSVYASHLVAGIISLIIGIFLGAIHFFKHAKKEE